MRKFFRNISNLIVGAIFVLVTFALSFIWWVFEPNTTVPLWVLSIVIVVFFLIILIIWAVFTTKKEPSVYRLPKIKSMEKLQNKYILIVEHNDLFGQGSLATISYQTDEESVEMLLGVGYVESISNNGNLQIEILPSKNNPDAQKILKATMNTKSYKKVIKVKPSLHKDIITEVRENG